MKAAARRPVRLFSIVFNEPYLTWFEQACVRSLLWPQNAAALRQAIGWDIWTTQVDAGRVRAAAAQLGVPLEVHDELPAASWADKEQLKPGLHRALTAEMARCADKHQAFLWIAPDSVFGDGSCASIMALGAAPNVCVALSPMRVNAEGFIEAMGDGARDNPALVKLAFERMHRGFAEADATLADVNSMESGVSWRRIGEGLYAITHRKHSAYLLQPTASDAKWFGDMKKFGAYDHSFPQRLVNEQRQRVVGSSDAAFVAELTPAASHRANLVARDPLEPDRFHQNLAHHAANRNVLAIWRAA